jgi:hypothetical protein
VLTLVRWLLRNLAGGLLDAILDTWIGKVITAMLSAGTVSLIGILQGVGPAEALTLGLIALAASAKAIIDVGAWRESRRRFAVRHSVRFRVPQGIFIVATGTHFDSPGGVFLICPEVILTNASPYRMALEIVATARLPAGDVECRPEMLAQNLTPQAISYSWSGESLRLLRSLTPLPHPVQFQGPGAQSGHLVLRVPNMRRPRYDDDDDGGLQALSDCEIIWHINDLFGSDPVTMPDATPRPREIF